MLHFKKAELCIKFCNRFLRSDSNKGLIKLKCLDKHEGLISGLPKHLNAPSKFRNLVKPFGFFLLVTGTSVTACGIWQYENIRKLTKADFNSALNMKIPKFGSVRKKISDHWINNLNEGQKLIALIIGMNVAVFIMWKISKFQPFLMNFFASHPNSKHSCLSMLLSSFSQYNTWHLTFNMIALWSFGTPALQILGKEQFLAFYLMAGTFSSLISYVLKIALQSNAFSMGASGAIMALVSCVCIQYPNAQLSLIILPWINFSALTALKGLLIFDSLGILMRWKLFDHAAHLGGMLFGM
ncbi:unnamed protein product [Gordionus sp. m RMFG-2023]